MKSYIVAIDPGQSGGIAVLPPGQRPHAYPMPDTEGEILDLLAELRLIADTESYQRIAVMEAQAGFSVPGGGTSAGSMFAFGDGYGFLRGVLRATHWRVELVRPPAWQKALALGHRGTLTRTQWKNKLKDTAARLNPELKVTLAIADALLILEYAKGLPTITTP
jgi:hypothetical protein